MNIIEIGSVVQDDKGTNWVVIKRHSYTASAHNDRWLDYNTVLLKVSKTGNVSKTSKTITTDDVMRGYKIVGKADVTFTVNVNNLYLDK